MWLSFISSHCLIIMAEISRSILNNGRVDSFVVYLGKFLIKNTYSEICIIRVTHSFLNKLWCFDFFKNYFLYFILVVEIVDIIFIMLLYCLWCFCKVCSDARCFCSWHWQFISFFILLNWVWLEKNILLFFLLKYTVLSEILPLPKFNDFVL